MKNLKRFFPCACALVAIIVFNSGCTTKYGQFVPNSQFVYPNSNVTSLGPTKASKSKTTFFIAPRWKVEDTKGTYQNACAQVPGANALVDYKEDTSFTSILFFNTITYTLEGTAVKMEVGKQQLK